MLTSLMCLMEGLIKMLGNKYRSFQNLLLSSHQILSEKNGGNEKKKRKKNLFFKAVVLSVNEVGSLTFFATKIAYAVVLR